MRRRTPPTTDESTPGALGAWNALGGGTPSLDEGEAPLFLPSSLRRGAGPGRGAAPVGGGGNPSGFLFGSRPFSESLLSTPGLRLGPGPGDDSAPGGRTPETAAGAAGPSGAREDGEDRSGRVGWATPQRGDVLGGFRVVAELGRGAFARVYLAEQIELGNRLVALKVSRAEGEEPQILARLQHTHIVPIHSVHDDPDSGLRLMCMPYLGGANLAQVLEAVARSPGVNGSANAHAHANGGGSLVAALDRVSQGLPSPWGPGDPTAALGRASFPAGGTLAPQAGGPHPAAVPDAPALALTRPEPGGASVGPPSLGRGSLDRIQQLWGRITGRVPAASGPGAGLDDRNFDQPARQFLRGANTVQAATWVVARLAEGLEHAHGRGLLHRDLKPSNVLIAGDGTPMLLDFNLSSPARPQDSDAGEKVMLGGTLPYMAPEHLDAFNPEGNTSPEAVDERSDIYALGLILFEMLAGEHPFPEPPRRGLLDTIRALTEMRRDPPSLRSRNRLIPPSLDAVVGRCLAFDPARRYARARELTEDLTRFLDDLPLKHTREPSLRERFAKWTRRNPRLCGGGSIAGFAALLIVSLGGLIGLFHGNMLNLSARLKLPLFREDWARCQLLLNVTGGPPGHLRTGVDLAIRTLAQQRIGPDGDWPSDAWPRRLTAAEQGEVREKTAELVLLTARAKVALAERSASAGERAGALGWAVRWLDRAERLDPSPPAALYGDRAGYLDALGDHDRAARDLALEARTPPRSARDFTLRGTARLVRGDLPGAEADLHRAVALDPRAFWSWFALGHCHFEQGRALEAAGDFAACLVLEPKFSWPHFNRGLALARAGRLVEAREAYDEAIKANPRFAAAWVDRALVDLELDDPAAAERGLGHALALYGGDQRDPALLAAWAEARARRGDHEGAETMFERLLGERPGDPVLLTARGVLRVGHDPAGAAADLRHALERNPHEARAHYGLALLLRKDNPRAALAEAEAALRDDPGLVDALQARAVLRGRLGDRGAADDAEQLVRVGAAHRLYNAACALALLAGSTGEARFAARASELLGRALDSGFPAARAAADPDLAPLHRLPAYRAALARPRPEAPAGARP